MPKKRSYGDACGIARALDTVGERWALMVVRELLLGPKRFTDIRAGIPAVGPDVLTQRLKDLADAGVVRRRRLPPPAASVVYELTDAGVALGPTLHQLGLWGAVHAPPPTDGMGMSLDAHLLSIATLFRPDLADGRSGRFALRLDGEDFHAIVAGGDATVGRGPVAAPDATITGSARELIDVLHGREELVDTALEIEGDSRLAHAFLTWCPLPLASA